MDILSTRLMHTTVIIFNYAVTMKKKLVMTCSYYIFLDEALVLN